ncbi:MAG: hypothetical protein JNK07_06665 [Alphaproteobacteria bacterium]|nr:hypothetical protein [Alphaproteobacteria bacterium]
MKNRTLVAASLLALALAVPANAATYTSTSTVIGNNTTVVVSGGTATVKSCSSGISGFFYQSLRLFFSSPTTIVTQPCP